MAAGLSLIASLLVVAQPAQAAPTTASDLPGLLRVAAETTTPKYDRSRFQHWIDTDRNGCNTRYEVLIAESTSPVTVGGDCSLSGGTWVSALDGAVAASPTQVEIDHHVALAEAWRSGASSWTDSQRRDFANDLAYPYVLNATSSASNQSKSDKDPAEWMPPNTAYRCEYATSWALVKYRWSLAVDSAELAALTNELSGPCGTTPVSLPTVAVTPRDLPTTPTVTTPGVGVTRLAGDDRYATAIQVSRQYAPNVPAVFVATGTNFPDALSAAAAASLIGGPLLLTPSATLPAAVANEINRLRPAKIYVLSGTGAVSAQTFNALRSIAPTTRLGKADRYTTGLHIVDSLFRTADTAFIATGRSFPDALAATGAAGAIGAPVILVDGARSSVPSAVVKSLQRLGVSKVVIAGGPGAVSSGIQNQLARAYSVTRSGGSDRYETAALVNSRFFPAGASDTAFLATGLNFPDALAGAALAGTVGAPLFVTAPTCVPASVRPTIAGFRASKTLVLGGTSVVSNAAAKNTGCLASAVPTVSGTTKVHNTLTARPGAWTAGTSYTYQWYASGAAIAGATGTSLKLGTAQAGKKISVKVTGRKSGYTTVTRTSAATAKIGYPASTTPTSKTCPSWARIKGNASSMIYHVPGGQYYDRTVPEECFSTEAAARAAGYRASKR